MGKRKSGRLSSSTVGVDVGSPDSRRPSKQPNVVEKSGKLSSERIVGVDFSSPDAGSRKPSKQPTVTVGVDFSSPDTASRKPSKQSTVIVKSGKKFSRSTESTQRVDNLSVSHTGRVDSVSVNRPQLNVADNSQQDPNNGTPTPPPKLVESSITRQTSPADKVLTIIINCC
jgi:hypothetical protein